MAPPQKIWLIVGASRGIGKGFVEQLLERGDIVYATVRGDVNAYFAGYDRCHVLRCDVTCDADIQVGCASMRS